MAILKASKLKESLRRAKKVGIIEESLTLGDVTVVLRNLQPEEMEQIIADADDLDDVAYYNSFQMGHVSRSIVEIDGQDLREADFIEIEIDQGEGKAPQLRVVERHHWLKEEYLRTWGREAISVAFRKVSELFIKAEERMKAGVQFDFVDELPEDKYRRLLGEIKEVEAQVQDEDLRKAILDEHGYLPASTPEERAAVQQRLEEFKQERIAQATQAAEPPAVPQPVQEAPAPLPPQQRSPSPSPAPEVIQVPSGPSPEELMASRRPLNQDAITPPSPQRTQARPVRQGLPPNVPAEPRQMTPLEASKAAESRGGMIASRQAQIQAEMAAMSELDPHLAAELEQAQAVPAQARPRDQIPELARKAEAVDGKQVVAILDRKPTGGINPHYKPRT